MPRRRGPKPFEFSEKQKEKILYMYSQGHTARQVAAALSTTPHLLLSFLRKQGVEIRGRAAPKKFISEQQLSELITAYNAGVGTEELASRCGMSAGGIAARLQKAGVTLRAPGFREGEDHHNWTGGRSFTEDGYVRVIVYPDDPYYAMANLGDAVNGNRYVLEHRIVMSRKIGRMLTEDETVHHKDLNRSNNDPSNLQLRVGKHGKGGSFRCCDCGSYNVEAAAL